MLARMSRIARTISRVGLTLCVLCGLLAGTMGFSIVPPGAIGGAFPCQGNGCGCRTASDCWFGCCCMSPSQRLAWARARDVEPPRRLLKLVADSNAPKAQPVACCAKHGQASCKHNLERVAAREGEAPAEPHRWNPASTLKCGSAGASPSRRFQAAATHSLKTAIASCCSKKTATAIAGKKPSPPSDKRLPYVESNRCHGPGQWWVTSGQPLGLPDRPFAMFTSAIAQPVLSRECRYSLDGQAPPTRPG